MAQAECIGRKGRAANVARRSHKKLQRGRDDGLGRVFLHQVPGVRHRLKPRMRHDACQMPAAFERNPLIRFAPQDLRRAADLRIARLDFIGITLVHLRDLSIERGLASFAEPRRDIWCEFFVGDVREYKP